MSRTGEKLQKSGVAFDAKTLEASLKKLHKLGLLERSVIPVAPSARTTWWRYAQIVVGSTVKMGLCGFGPVACGLAVVDIGIDIDNFACEIHGCKIRNT